MSLDDPLSKIGRAVTHFMALRELHGGTDRRLRNVTAERLRDGLEFQFHVGDIEPLDPAWPLLVGDAYHNLRAALDQLVYQLHVRHYKGLVPPDAEEQSMFPVPRTTPTAKNPLGSRDPIRRLSQQDKNAIDFLQWYRGWGTSYPPKRGIWQLRRAIYDINRLDIIDKHRRIHVSLFATQTVYRPSFASSYGFDGEAQFGKELESGGIVDIWRFTREPPRHRIEEYERQGVATTVSISLDGDRLEVIPHLGGCIHATKRVMDRFASRFPPPTVVLDLSAIHRIDPLRRTEK